MVWEQLNTGSTMSYARELKTRLRVAPILTIPTTVLQMNISKLRALIMTCQLIIDCTTRETMEMVIPDSFKQNQMGYGNLPVIIT
jgi:hypothetical protein